MYKAFEEALIDKYKELNPDTSVTETKTDEKPKKAVKCLINGAIVIFASDGSVYNLNGERIK